MKMLYITLLIIKKKKRKKKATKCESFRKGITVLISTLLEHS
jgi:hypothetical protein